MQTSLLGHLVNVLRQFMWGVLYFTLSCHSEISQWSESWRHWQSSKFHCCWFNCLNNSAIAQWFSRFDGESLDTKIKTKFIKIKSRCYCLWSLKAPTFYICLLTELQELKPVLLRMFECMGTCVSKLACIWHCIKYL